LANANLKITHNAFAGVQLKKFFRDRDRDRDRDRFLASKFGLGHGHGLGLGKLEPLLITPSSKINSKNYLQKNPDLVLMNLQIPNLRFL